MSRMFSLLLVGLTLFFGCSSDNDAKKTVSPAPENKLKSEVKPNVNTELMQELIDWLKNPVYTKKRQYVSSIGLGGSLGGPPYPETYVEHYDDKYNDEEYIKFGKDIVPELVEVLYCNPQDFIVRKICRVLYEIDATATQRDLMEFCFNNETSNSHRLIVLEHFEQVFKKDYDNDVMKSLTVMFAFADADVRLQLSEMIRKFKTKGVEKVLVEQFNTEDSIEIRLSLAETVYTLHPNDKQIILRFINKTVKEVKKLKWENQDSLFNLISMTRNKETLEILFELYENGTRRIQFLLLEPIAYFTDDTDAAKVLCSKLHDESTGYMDKKDIVEWLKSFDFDFVLTSVLQALNDNIAEDKEPMKVSSLTHDCLAVIRIRGNKDSVSELEKLKGVNTDFDEDIDFTIKKINERLAKQ